jgi:LPXTG-site transpeptidase (sortase) family protein
MITSKLPLLVNFLAGVVVVIITAYMVLGVLNNSITLVGRVAGEFTNVTDEANSTTGFEKQERTYGFPVRLIIEKLAVDGNIVHSGLTEDGDMEAPEKIDELGWYKYGPRPGMPGSAVIAGHVGIGESGIFENLHELQKGDTFLVIDENDREISFVVRDTKIYDYEEHSEEVFFSNEGYHLNLITCTGDWLNDQQTMTKRLVVFSDRI